VTIREHAPVGAPCWADLWTSDVEGSRRFYAELFDWEAAEPSEEFGGYFMFLRDGVPTAGGMGPMGDMPAGNVWTIYLATDDIAAAAKRAEAAGADLFMGPEPVADLGIQLQMADPSGATVGMWQEGTFPGFTVLDEPGAPSWCELHTRDHAGALAFYKDVFGWATETVGDTDDFRYAVALAEAGSEEQVAGVMDATAWLGEDGAAVWSIYFNVEDARAAADRVVELGGSIVDPAVDTPYGVLATVADPAGAVFKLRTTPAG
jgi:predicted enzyme related to lactoylglutathione lyase